MPSVANITAKKKLKDSGESTQKNCRRMTSRTEQASILRRISRDRQYPGRPDMLHIHERKEGSHTELFTSMVTKKCVTFNFPA